MTNETNKEKHEKFIEWLALTDEGKIRGSFPLTQKEFAIHHGITEQTLVAWKHEIESGELGDGRYNADEYLANSAQKADAALMKACERGNAQALRTYYQLTKRTEKAEDNQKFEYSPTDRIRIARETVTGLREQYLSDGGNCPVCGRCKEICNTTLLDTEPKQPEDREVATVALSPRPD